MSFEATADVQPQVDDDEGDDTNWDIDVEAPPPIDLCENAPKKRSEAGSNGEHNVLDREVRSTFSQRYKVAENHLSEQIDTTGSKACTIRPKMRTAPELAIPHIPLSIAKTVTAAIIGIFLPHISPS
jgi:hypothetical protein